MLEKSWGFCSCRSSLRPTQDLAGHDVLPHLPSDPLNSFFDKHYNTPRKQHLKTSLLLMPSMKDFKAFHKVGLRADSEILNPPLQVQARQSLGNYFASEYCSWVDSWNGRDLCQRADRTTQDKILLNTTYFMLSELLWELLAPLKISGQSQILSNHVYIHGMSQRDLQEAWTKMNANDKTLILM